MTEQTNVGRPTVMTTEMQDRLIDLLSKGKSNREACAELGIDVGTLYHHTGKDPEFFHRYDTAKKNAVDALVDQAGAVVEDALRAENGTQVAAAKLVADHKWREASRRAPQRWGEKAQVELTGKVETTDPAELAKRLAFLEAAGQAADAQDDEA